MPPGQIFLCYSHIPSISRASRHFLSDRFGGFFKGFFVCLGGFLRGVGGFFCFLVVLVLGFLGFFFLDLQKKVTLEFSLSS